jgi:hypothetical protein
VTTEEYLEQHPDRQVTVRRNAQHSQTDKRLRVTIEQLQGPYKPKVLGVHVRDTVSEALTSPAVPLPDPAARAKED